MMDYSIHNLFGIGFSYIFTKLFYRKARLVRLPVFVRGTKGIVYQEGLTTGHGCRLDAVNDKTTLYIGKNARFGDYVHINAEERVVIGDNVLTASKVFISDTNHGQYKGNNQSDPDTNPSERESTHAEIVIGDNVWIGENAVILPGSHIGDGCIVGANTLISGKHYPAHCMIVGSPGRVIKKYSKKTKQWELVDNDEL